MIKAPKSLFFKSTMVFLFFFILFLAGHLLNDQFLSTDDIYYHAKHAFLIEQSGDLILVKPWLEFHFFNYAPVDPWWGFHLGMALFIHWLGLFLGVKIFVSLLAALVFSIFYLVLNKLKVKYSLVWTIFLFFSSINFSYRLFLERPHLLSMIVLPLVFLLLIKGRNFWLFVLSLLYALCYNMAPLVIFLVLFYLAIEAYANRRINLRPLIASAGGVLAGIIIHPASLNYLYIMYINFCRIIFLKFSGIELSTRNEMLPTGFFSFLSLNFLAFLFYILAVVLFLSLKKIRKGKVISNFLFLYSSSWLLMALLLPRGVEYWLPVGVLFIAVVFNDFLETEEFKQINLRFANKENFKIAGLFLTSILVLIVSSNLGNIFNTLRYNGMEEQNLNYEQASLWLKANTEKDSIVFCNDTLMWPMMFFYNDYNHYIHGIDTTFLYEYDVRTYWLWRNISAQGLSCDQPTPCLNLSRQEQMKLVPLTIKTVFRSKYAAVLNYENSNLIRTLNSLQSEVKLVFKNKNLLIYEIK